MSSWDWEKALIPQHNGRRAKERTHCKLGRHLVLEGVPMVWLAAPMGLSCLECARPVAPEAVTEEESRLKAPKVKAPGARVPRQRDHFAPGGTRTVNAEAAARSGRTRRKAPEEWVHGKWSTYVNHGCRCPECKGASRVRSARVRAAKLAGAQS